MKNAHVREQLSSYIDKVLSAAETKQVEQHLTSCAECRQVLSEMQGVVNWMKKVPKPEARMGLEGRMIARLEEAPKRRGFSWFSFSSGLATVMVAVLVFVMVRHDRASKQELGNFDFIGSDDSLSRLQFQETIKSAESLQTYRLLTDKEYDENKRAKGVSVDSIQQKAGYTRSVLPFQSSIQANQSIPMEAQAPITQGRVAPAAPRAEYEKAQDGKVIMDGARPVKLASKPAPVPELPGKDKNEVLKKAKTDSSGIEHLTAKELRNNELPDTDSVSDPRLEGASARRDSMRARNISIDTSMGSFCNIKRPERRLVRSQKEWEKLLSEMGPEARKNIIRAPDFSKQMVAALFMGEKPSTGYSIFVVGTSLENNVLIIEVRETSPSTDVMTATVLTQPYQLKPIAIYHGPVKFRDVK